MDKQLYNFTCKKGEITIASIHDFWKFHFSNEWALMSEISEFLVAKALGQEIASNKKYWTLYDIKYNGICVEVKETAYCHSWGEKASTSQRVFGIEKSYGYKERKIENFKRYNNIYVFCLNTIVDPKEASPLDADTWDFYVVKTSVIDEIFRDQKKISLGRLKWLVQNGKGIKCDYSGIESAIINSFSKEELLDFSKKNL